MYKHVLSFLTLFLLMVTPSLASKQYVVLTLNKTFASQCTGENTIYEVRYDFNLNGARVRIPKGSVLKFNGGSLNNGQLTLQTGTKLLGTGEKLDRIMLGISDKNVEDVFIEGLDFQGYKNSAKKKEEIVIGLRVYPGGSVNGLTVSNCKIHGYNAGASIRGSNVTIKDNVFYDNGHKETVGGVHDDEYDVCAGYSPNNQFTCNFIITGNRCLSKYVHRNIDCGELLSEDNIIISNNICVSMDGTSQEAALDDVRKAQCILVGYTGLSEKAKGTIVSNNICKGCSWAGIYVRANNTVETAGQNGYVAMISGNYIENIVKTSTSKFGAGIACELRDGSIISNNIIKNCTQGVNIGQINAAGHVKVFGNSIDNCEYGILNDAIARKVDITDNSITNVSRQGIAITEATVASSHSAEKFVNISDNTVTLKQPQAKKEKNGESSIGVFIYNIGTASCRVYSNYIHGSNADSDIGVQFRCNSQTSSLTIRDNYVSGCNAGISRIAGSDKRGKDYKVLDNDLGNCTTEFSGF